MLEALDAQASCRHVEHEQHVFLASPRFEVELDVVHENQLSWLERVQLPPALAVRDEPEVPCGLRRSGLVLGDVGPQRLHMLVSTQAITPEVCLVDHAIGLVAVVGAAVRLPSLIVGSLRCLVARVAAVLVAVEVGHVCQPADLLDECADRRLDRSLGRRLGHAHACTLPAWCLALLAEPLLVSSSKPM